MNDPAREDSPAFFDLGEFLAAACELLAIPSTAAAPEQLRRAVDFVVDYVGSGSGSGFTVERFESHGKPSALLYPPAIRPTEPAGRPAFRVILNGHADVVPGGEELFRPRRVGDRLYGRGAHDMKLTLLAQALVFRELAPRLPFPVALQVVADEEVGGDDGTGHQAEQGVTGDFVVIGEGSGLDVVTDSKGVVRAALTARGDGAHGAYPWLGRNALTMITNAVSALLDHYPVPAAEKWCTTVNLARISTPNRAVNQVPAEAEALLDIRFPIEDDRLAGKSAAEVGDYLRSLCGPEAKVTVSGVTAPQHADPRHPDVLALQAAARRAGGGGNLVRRHGSNDAHHFAAHRTTAVSFGIGGSGQHGPDEYADLPTIGPYCRALADFLHSLSPAGS